MLTEQKIDGHFYIQIIQPLKSNKNKNLILFPKKQKKTKVEKNFDWKNAHYKYDRKKSVENHHKLKVTRMKWILFPKTC